jgi:hypothetical protein
MEETTEVPTLQKHAIRWALILAAISIIITMLLYAIDYTLMVQLKFLAISLVIYLGLTIYGGIEYRKLVGGYLPFGKAYIHGLIILAGSGLVATIFSLLLYTVVDPELPQKLVDASIENTRAMMEQFGAPEDKIEEGIEKARADIEKGFSTVGVLTGYIRILIFSAVMALISGAIVKKNQPEMM